jgi:6-phosphogluconolactonase
MDAWPAPGGSAKSHGQTAMNTGGIHVKVAQNTPTQRARVHPDPSALALAVTRDCIALARSCIAAQGTFRIALAGGHTPAIVYRQLAMTSPDKARWSCWEVFYGDERCVSRDDPLSNHRMARAAWLDHVPIPVERIHPMVNHPDQPENDALAYARTLAALADTDGWPVLDLILLGVGADGHTASLFPGTDIIHVTDRPVAAVRHPDDGRWRISLTRPVLARARALWFLVTGSGKADVLRRVLLPRTPQDRTLPAVLCDRADAVWHVDRASAGGLLP